MKFYVYRTVNLVNGKEYIGVHKSNNIDSDKYCGSGKLINRAIKKHGRQNFSREILKVFDSYKDAFAFERVLVTDEYVKLSSNYNVAPGGIGGMGKVKWSVSRKKKHGIQVSLRMKNLSRDDRISRARKAGNTMRGRTKYTHQYLMNASQKISLKLKNHPILKAKAKQRWADNREKFMEWVKNTAIKRTGVTKDMCRGRASQAQKISGENNPMKRQDVINKFIGKTKQNCEWRARQAIKIKETQANFSIEKKKEISEKISSKISGVNNGMYGRFGELSPVAKYSNAQHDEAIKLFNDGMSRHEISAILGVNYQTIKVWLRGR